MHPSYLEAGEANRLEDNIKQITENDSEAPHWQFLTFLKKNENKILELGSKHLLMRLFVESNLG